MEVTGKNVLLRRPCLMEDEGHYHPYYVFDDFDDVSNWLEDNDYVDGYFSPEDFVYAGVGGPGVNRYKIRGLGRE